MQDTCMISTSYNFIVFIDPIVGKMNLLCTNQFTTGLFSISIIFILICEKHSWINQFTIFLYCFTSANQNIQNYLNQVTSTDKQILWFKNDKVMKGEECCSPLDQHLYKQDYKRSISHSRKSFKGILNPLFFLIKFWTCTMTKLWLLVSGFK